LIPHAAGLKLALTSSQHILDPFAVPSVGERNEEFIGRSKNIHGRPVNLAVAAWASSKFGGHAVSFYPYALHEAAFTRGWAKFIVYGHTHHYEIVPLQSVQQEKKSVDQIYINSGTWRPVHELARLHPGQKHFVGYHVMTLFGFLQK
jgi:hypothetical protein